MVVNLYRLSLLACVASLCRSRFLFGRRRRVAIVHYGGTVLLSISIY
jgi:hypothetical protein